MFDLEGLHEGFAAHMMMLWLGRERRVRFDSMPLIDAAASLRSAIAEIPVPGSPPRVSRRGSSMSLAFLEIALNMNHVRRLTERVSILEHRTARRFVEVDVNLRLIDERPRSLFVGTDLREDVVATPAQRLWIPVARIPNDNAIPIDVRDGAGNRVPRMTQFESSQLLAAGLYRLLWIILSSHQDARDKSSDLNAFLYQLHEPRYLVETALVTLLTERNLPGDSVGSRPRTNGTVEGIGWQQRQLAADILNRYEDILVHFYSLLRIALQDYLLVVSLSPAIDEHALTYESPLTIKAHSSARRTFRQLNFSRRGIFVTYNVQLPSTIRSYHLVAETQDGLEVHNMYLSTNADVDFVQEVASDLRNLGERLQSRPSSTKVGREADKILELEVQSVARRIADLLRRRRWESSRVGGHQSFSQFQSCEKIAHACLAGEAVPGDGSEIDNSIIRHPLITSRTLFDAATEIEDASLGEDLSFEADPASNRAHAYWRRSDSKQSNLRQVEVRAGMLIVDPTASAEKTVRMYCLAVSALAIGVGVFAGGSWLYFTQAVAEQILRSPSKAAIAIVLVVVPGILYARLALPDRRSVNGHIQALPRVVARISLFLITALATTVLGVSGSGYVQAGLILTSLVPLMLVVILFRGSTEDLGDLRSRLLRFGGPKWLAAVPNEKEPMQPDIAILASSPERISDE